MAEKIYADRRYASEEEMDALKALNRRFEQLKTNRAQALSRWRELAEHQRPRGLRDQTTDTDQVRESFSTIINGRPLFAARTLASGMMSGITSPSRPWFRLAIQAEPEVREAADVKEWLSLVERVLREAMAQSNLYKALPQVYEDQGPFGISAMLIDEDVEDVFRCYVFVLGSYVLAASPRGDIDTMMRECSLTVSQCLELFGEENCSERIINFARSGNVDQRITVRHAIFPNREYMPGVFGPKGKPWASKWWEADGPQGCGFLRQGGYNERPIMTPRWATVGDDVYGFGPGDPALGDCKALQLLERRKAQLVERLVSPPMTAPSAAQTQRLQLLPGVVDYVDTLGGANAGLRPSYEANPQALVAVQESINAHEERIDEAFFADLWLMLQSAERQMTAREVQERREEKLLQLGTVLESLQDEMLDPIIDRVFAILLRMGRIPPAPKVLQGRELKVEFISIMAAAQKLISTTSIERIATFVANLAAVAPQALDKLDMDQLIDELADALGVPPQVIRTDEAVEALRQARAEAAQKAAAVEQAAVGAKAAKDLAGVSLTDDNAAGVMARQLGIA